VIKKFLSVRFGLFICCATSVAFAFLYMAKVREKQQTFVFFFIDLSYNTIYKIYYTAFLKE